MRALKLLLLLQLTACSSKPVEFKGVAMQIPYKVLVGERLNFKKKQAVQASIEAVFHEIDTVFNDWNPSSEVSQLAKAEKDTETPLSEPLAKLFHEVDTLYQKSEGRFDITIAPLLITYRSALQLGKLPEPEKVVQAIARTGWEKVRLHTRSLTKAHAELAFDLGGIAKGVAVDNLVEKLHALGLTHLYVEWGGELRAAGHHPAMRPWRVSLHPSHTILELKDQAVATSGDAFQHWEVAGHNYFHIIDPRTKTPLEKGSTQISSVTVTAPTCTLADALATILMLFPSATEAEAWLAKSYPEICCTIIERKG